MHPLAAPSHPQRASLSAEMHVRRLPRIAAPARLMQIVTLLGEGAARTSRDVIAALGVQLHEHARHAIVPMGDFTLVWEGHTEFASYTFVRHGAFADPFDADHFASVDDFVAGLPGEVIRATQIAILPPDLPIPDEEALAAMFAPQALIVCDVAQGAARIMSDFVLHADGYGRLLIADRGLVGDETAQLVARVQELGNYRNMALLGLPTAQAMTGEVSRLERRLSALTHDMAEAASEDDALLEELTIVSAELARITAATRYRMSATRAYAQLSYERLAALHVAPVRGYQTLADFTERRLVPAVRTCESFTKRIDDLSERASWTSALLRTRIDTALARQNRDLLASMDRRNAVQLRLQQAVEGLSVVAISYYLVGLIGYLVKAFPGDHHLAMALAVPLVLLLVAAGVWRLRRSLHH